MAQNPFLKVFIQSGYYDGATNYFQAKYTMWQVDPSGKMKDRFYFEGYRSGHMMYLRAEDLKKSKEDDEFDDWGDEEEENNDEKYWFTKDKIDLITSVHNYLDS